MTVSSKINKGTAYADINDLAEDPRRKFAPAFTEADDKPTQGQGFKCYFSGARRDGTPYTVECDLSPGCKLVPAGDAFSLVEGHVRFLCPECGNPGHIEAREWSIYVSTARRIEYTDSSGALWLLPTITVLRAIMCDYREGAEHDGLGCRWVAHIAEGRAYPVDKSAYGKGKVAGAA